MKKDFIDWQESQNEENYTIVGFPEVQSLQEFEDFEDNSIPCDNPEEYQVLTEWYEEKKLVVGKKMELDKREKVLFDVSESVDNAYNSLKKLVITELKKRNLDKVEHMALYSDFSNQYKYETLKQEDLEIEFGIGTKYFHNEDDTIILNGFKIIKLWNDEESVKILRYNVDEEEVTEEYIPGIDEFLECAVLFNEWLKEYDSGRINIF